ncbi:MAG: lytic transglycosylase domain-containing protein [Gammaproteobacteria bacterium]|nr:lytic transglycosylase domain-containing protein [Gammaproteobacteria bacterium]
MESGFILWWSNRLFQKLTSIGIILLLLGAPAVAEVYKYQSSSGKIYLTDRPMKGGNYKLLWRSGADPLFGGSGARVDHAAYKRNRSRYTPLIDQVAESSRLNSGLLHAVVRVESSYDPAARSKKGALGLMQLMPGTARRYGVSDALDPQQNLTGGARYLKDLLEMFDQDLTLALAAYNAGENAVKRFGNKIPPFPETQDYVRKVTTHYRRNLRQGS